MEPPEELLRTSFLFLKGWCWVLSLGRTPRGGVEARHDLDGLLELIGNSVQKRIRHHAALAEP